MLSSISCLATRFDDTLVVKKSRRGWSVTESQLENGDVKMAQSSPHVQFPEGVKAEERQKLKQQPTQKYDRKEIQKRLDTETWMEEQLLDLYQDSNYPQLDIDDVLKISESDRKQKLTEYLQESKKPADSFITELLEKAKGVKPISS